MQWVAGFCQLGYLLDGGQSGVWKGGRCCSVGWLPEQMCAVKVVSGVPGGEFVSKLFVCCEVDVDPQGARLEHYIFRLERHDGLVSMTVV